MRKTMRMIGTVCAGVGAAAAALSACASRGGGAPAPTPAGEPESPRVALPTQPPAPGETARVGGDLLAKTHGRDGEYRFGSLLIDTPLPEGYPLPTPPGAIDIKTYPSVRVAEVAGAGDPDSGMNATFWPLFKHIQRHRIAMTSPVEMNYQGMREGEVQRPSEWSMAFLYRTADMNKTGQEGVVRVRDAEPVTVVAVGVKGDYSMSLVKQGREAVERWLREHPEWIACGDWRALYYNGPKLFYWNKWAEVQVPVRAAE